MSEPRKDDAPAGKPGRSDDASSKPNSTTPEPKHRLSIEFLQKFRPDGSWLLTAIAVDRTPENSVNLFRSRT